MNKYDLVSTMNLEAFKLFNSDLITLSEYTYIIKYIDDIVYNGEVVKTMYENIINFFKKYDIISIKKKEFYWELSIKGD